MERLKNDGDAKIRKATDRIYAVGGYRGPHHYRFRTWRTLLASWREQALVMALGGKFSPGYAARAAINFALLEDEFSDVELILQDDSYQIRGLDELEEPLRKTQATLFGLQAYEIVNRERGESIDGSRWIRFDLPQ